LVVRTFKSTTRVDSRGIGDRTKPGRTDSGHHEIETHLRSQAVGLFDDQLREGSPGLAESDQAEAELS
jgi:hypothetical protein